MVTRILADASATEALGAELALVARPGTLIRLAGGLGAGKTTLARGFIRALLDGSDEDIPSPTFTLVQTYGEARIPVAHADLYRLAGAGQTAELGFEDLLRDHVLLVEWPEKLEPGLARDVLTVRLAGHGDGRQAELSAAGSWEQGLARLEAIAGFLAATDWRGAARRFLEGDASFRRYETLSGAAGDAILMDMPARPDGPPVKNGLPYSAVAHLAENISAVVAVNRGLIARGYSAPAIHACDTGQGLAVIEDLGRAVYGRMKLGGADMREPMETAVRLLADMAARDWPGEVAVDAAHAHRIPAYDRQALAIETGLLTRWYWPHRFGADIPVAVEADFTAAWDSLFPMLETERRVWTLRDFHSPNLLWLPERTGHKRVGLIDTQDCVLGHPAYDLVSLLQDARVTVEPSEADRLLDLYCGARHGAGAFDEVSFRAAFALLGAQRATKILGIFARLNRRDGKPAYLRHMPRVAGYLARNLRHPALAPLAAWHGAHLPEILCP